LSKISDQELEGGLKELVAAGRRIEAHVVAHLMEVEARRLHLRAGYRSMFEYCLERLGFTEYEAFSRINAARMAAEFPMVVELLERRELNLTTLYLVRDYVSVENHAQLFSEVANKSKREVSLLLARRCPRPDVPARVRKLPGSSRECGIAGLGGAVEPLSGSSYRLQMTLSEGAQAKLELARDLLSHANPSGDLAVVVERAFDVLIEKMQKRQFGKAAPELGRAAGDSATSKPTSATSATSATSPAIAVARKSRARAPAHQAAGRRHVPNEVRRRVVERDGGCCTFIGTDGHRCSSRAFLQLHHEIAFAHGGGETFDNLRLLCAAHNRLLAEVEFGQMRVDAAIATRQSSKASGQLREAGAGTRFGEPAG
jgi:5-methylcytosine-specific restriction endonuclease McrA